MLLIHLSLTFHLRCVVQKSQTIYELPKAITKYMTLLLIIILVVMKMYRCKFVHHSVSYLRRVVILQSRFMFASHLSMLLTLLVINILLTIKV